MRNFQHIWVPIDWRCRIASRQDCKHRPNCTSNMQPGRESFRHWLHCGQQFIERQYREMPAWKCNDACSIMLLCNILPGNVMMRAQWCCFVIFFLVSFVMQTKGGDERGKDSIASNVVKGNQMLFILSGAWREIRDASCTVAPIFPPRPDKKLAAMYHMLCYEIFSHDG